MRRSAPQLVLSFHKLNKVICPDLRAYRRKLLIFLILFSTILIVLLLLDSFAKFEVARDDYFLIALILLGLGVVILLAVLCSIFYTRFACVNALIHLINKIEKRDKVSVFELRLKDCTEAETAELLKRLIDTGNLPNHVLWENKLLARRGLEVTPLDLGLSPLVLPPLGKCPNCGANMTEHGCEYCGFKRD